MADWVEMALVECQVTGYQWLVQGFSNWGIGDKSCSPRINLKYFIKFYAIQKI
ncbi:MAG: hypothetical protein ACETVO_03355 [bacterium]